MAEQRGYLAYLLRLWQVNDDGKPVWRASLESPHTGERVGFGSLEALFAFLEENTGGFAPGAQPQAKPGNQRKGVENKTQTVRGDK